MGTGFRYDLRLRSRGSFLLVGIWCLMCVVLANGYGGVLFSFMSVTKLHKPINSLEELANSTEIKLLIQGQTGLADRFMVMLSNNLIIKTCLNDNLIGFIVMYQNATSGTEKALGDSLRKNPGTLFSILGEAIKMLMTGKYAFTYVFIDQIKENYKSSLHTSLFYSFQ